jgi:hypothetical protein
VLARRSDNGPCVVAVVTNELHPLQPQQARSLLYDGREDLLGCRARRDEGGKPSQRSLLLAEATHLVVRLRVRDCGRDQVRERGQPLNISAGAASCATSVATRRSADCSSAIRSNVSRDPVFSSVTARVPFPSSGNLRALRFAGAAVGAAAASFA